MVDAPSIVINLPGYPFSNLPSVATIAALRARPSQGNTAGSDIVVDAGSVKGDGLGGLFNWSSDSLAADDGANVIKPNDRTSLQAGRWVASATGVGVLRDQFALPTGASLIGRIAFPALLKTRRWMRA